MNAEILLSTNVDDLPDVLGALDEGHLDIVRRAAHQDARLTAARAYERWGARRDLAVYDFDRLLDLFMVAAEPSSVCGKVRYDRGHGEAVLQGWIDGRLYDFHLVPSEVFVGEWTPKEEEEER